MKDKNSTQEQLIDEIIALRQKNTELKTIKSDGKCEQELQKIKWLLTKNTKLGFNKRESYQQPYGKLSDLNTCLTILDGVGEDVLKDIIDDFLDLLDTSSAIYEVNGDYALGIFSSGWCRLLDNASRKLCNTEDNRNALKSGKWHCHESCWNKASKVCIENGQPVDIEFLGGIHLYAIPIWAGREIIGSINLGYGDPPKDLQKLQEIGKIYNLNIDDLIKEANAYKSRPPFIIEIAKKRLETAAKLIGTMVERKRIEETLTKRTYDLGERVKELNCLYGISNLIEKKGGSLEQILQGTFGFIPSAWQYPEITCARIIFKDKTFKTENFKETQWKLAQDIVVHGDRISSLEVYYLEERPERDEGSFLKEERTLINAIAERLGRVIESKWADEKIKTLAKFPSENPNPVLRVAKGGKVLYANDASLPLLAEWNSGVGELMPNDWNWLIAESFDSKQDRFEEFKVKDRVFSFMIIPVADNDYVNIYGRDITEQKQAEEELKKYHNHLEDLVKKRTNELTKVEAQLLLMSKVFKDATDPIIIEDLDGRIIDLNLEAERVYGWTRDELFGQPIKILVPPQRHKQADELLEQCKQGESIRNIEGVRWDKSGQEYPVLLTLSLLLNEAGKPIGIATITKHITELKKAENELITINEQLKLEITERKRAEEELRKSEASLSKAQQIAHLGSWDWNIETDEEIWSDEQFRIFGYEPGEIRSAHNLFVAVIHPDDRERVLLAVQQAIDGTKSYEIEFRIIQPDKTVQTILAKGNVFRNKDDKPVRMVGTVLDITDRNRMEEELQKIEKLEAIGVLAGGIAHDFNNLLTGVIGNLSLAELYVKPGDNIYEILQRAKKASKRTGQLTKQLLTFSKGGAPIKETASILELIEDTASFSLRGSKVRCEYSLPDNLWSIEIDKGQISQIINNLIINAAHAMPDGGIITISAENVITNGNKSLPLKKGRYIKISVKDQGIGIPEEQLGKIFDPYFTTKESGSGLGLASCYSIAKNHGGYITVESEVGAGTTFDIYLPVSDKEVFEVKEIVEEKVFHDKGKILFMDDEEEVINTAQQMIKQLGYDIKIAKNGIQAINMYKKAKESGGPFDLVILDLTIPGDMGGEKTIKRLLEIDPDVKAIVSSGYSNNIIMAEYKEYGFKGVVAKPYEIQQLSEVLYKVINGKDLTVPI